MGGLAQGAGEQNAVAGLSGPGFHGLGIHRQHQPIPNAGAVVEGPQLPPDPERVLQPHRSQQGLRYQHRQRVRSAGEPGYLQGKAIKPGAVVFMGECRRLQSNPLQQHLVAGLSRHVVHLSVVMVHLMRAAAGIDLKIPGGGTGPCLRGGMRI